MLGALGIFLYVGVEVGLASIAVNYFLQQGVSVAGTAHFFGGWGAFGGWIMHAFGLSDRVGIASALFRSTGAARWLGRLLGSWMLTKVKAGGLLGTFGILATLMLLLSMMSHGQVAIWSLVLCGFFNSIMFPNIFALGIAGLGPMTSKGSGLIMTAVVGGRDYSAAAGRAGRSFRDPACIPAADVLLHIHCVLWIGGAQAQPAHGVEPPDFFTKCGSSVKPGSRFVLSDGSGNL